MKEEFAECNFRKISKGRSDFRQWYHYIGNIGKFTIRAIGCQ